MFRAAISIALLITLPGCNSERTDPEFQPVGERQKLAQPLSKDLHQGGEAEIASTHQHHVEKDVDNASETSPEEALYLDDWVIKRQTDNLGVEIGLIQIETAESFLSDDERTVLSIDTKLTGDISLSIQKTNGRNRLLPYESSSDPTMRRTNDIEVQVVSESGDTQTANATVVKGDYIRLPSSAKANILLKKCFMSEESFSIAVKYRHFGDIGTYRGIQLNGYNEKVIELKNLVQQRRSRQ